MLLLIGFVSSVVVAAMFLEQARENEKLAKTERELRQSETRLKKKAQDALTTAEQAEREKTERLWDSHLSEARAQRRSGLAGSRFESLAVLKNAAQLLAETEATPERVQRLRNEWIACSALPVDYRLLRGLPEGRRLRGMDASGEMYGSSEKI